MEDFSLHLLDVAQNALAAGAGRIEISIFEQSKEDLMTIEIRAAVVTSIAVSIFSALFH